MNLPELLQKLEADSLVTFFVLDLTGIGGTEVFRFHPGTNELMAPVVWQGVTYEPFPVEAEGFELNVKGTLPRPTLKVSAVTSSLTPYITLYQDFVGASVTRKRTFARYLDGQTYADPGQHYDDELYYVERKVSDDGDTVTFELSSALDLEGVRLPGRTISVNSCPWVYRQGDCPYTGTNYFDIRDLPVLTSDLDVCSKTAAGCKVRFGARAILPFGGFPAARTYKV